VFVGVAPVVIAVDDPRRADIVALLERHLAFAHEHSPPEDVHALDLDGLLMPTVTFFSARQDGTLLAIGALKELDAGHAELKSMHTVAAARRNGVGRSMVAHLVGVARERDYRRVSLETGTMDAYEPARSLYAACGFRTCEPFGSYSASPNSAFLTLTLRE